MTKRTRDMPETPTSTNFESVLQEHRIFKPSKEFTKRAHITSLAQYRKLYQQSVTAPEKFWARQAKEELVWFKPWKKVLQWKEPFAKWFVGGQLNVCYNCLDRHLETPVANKAALIWEGEPAAPGKPAPDEKDCHQTCAAEFAAGELQAGVTIVECERKLCP